MVAGKPFPGGGLGPERVAGALAGLSRHGRGVVSRAYDEAYGYASDFVGTAHLLMGLVADTSHSITATLHGRNVDLETVRRCFEQTTGAHRPESPRHVHLAFSPHARAVLIDAAELARDAGSAITDVDHLWAGISRAQGAVAHRLMFDLGQLEFLRELCGEFPGSP